MKKKLTKYIKEIEKGLKEFDLSLAIEQIKKAIDSLEDEKEVSLSVNNFTIPDKVKNVQNMYILYSDGACRGNPGPGSYGCLIQNSIGEILFDHADVFELTTNNQMEMSGIINGLKILGKKLNEKGLSISQIQVLVITDSKYVIDGITKWVPGWKANGWKKANKKPPENIELWKTLDLLKEKIGKIEFEWVKGHAGHPQNEYCDSLANKALDNAGY